MNVYSGTAETGNKKIKWKTTFGKDLKFRCSSCLYCCSLGDIRLSRKDVERLGMNAVERADGSYILKGTADGPCKFLSGNKCSIYAKRPFLCYEYPFKVTFFGDEAIIDVTYSCNSIANELFSSKNEIDFDELVKNNYENLKDYINRMDFKKPKSIPYDDDFFSKLIDKSSDKWEANSKRLLELFRKNKNKYSYRSVDGNGLYFIYHKGKNIIFENLEEKKILNLNKKKITDGTKKLIIDYFDKIWKRATTAYDFYYTANKMKANRKELFSKLNGIMMRGFQFYASMIAEKNDHETIEEKDVKETIIMLDGMFFTPASDLATSGLLL